MTTILQKIRYFIWTWGLEERENECPYCRGELLGHYCSSFPGEYWTCRNEDCEFNGKKPKKKGKKNNEKKKK